MSEEYGPPTFYQWLEQLPPDELILMLAYLSGYDPEAMRAVIERTVSQGL